MSWRRWLRFGWSQNTISSKHVRYEGWKVKLAKTCKGATGHQAPNSFLVLSSHKFDHTRTANTQVRPQPDCKSMWLAAVSPCRAPIGRLSPLHCLFTSPSCWGTHFLYLSNPPSGNLLPIIPCPTPCIMHNLHTMMTRGEHNMCATPVVTSSFISILYLARFLSGLKACLWIFSSMSGRGSVTFYRCPSVNVWGISLSPH